MSDCCKQGDYVTQIIDTDTLYIASYFTPQGDGIRDYFEVFVNNKTNNNHSPIKVKVKNGWGTALESNDYKSDWFGDKNKEGKYKFEVTYNSVTVTGHVCILRQSFNNCPDECMNCNDPIIQNCY